MIDVDRLCIILKDRTTRVGINLDNVYQIGMDMAVNNSGGYDAYLIIEGGAVIDTFTHESIGLAEQLAGLKDEDDPEPEPLELEWVTENEKEDD